MKIKVSVKRQVQVKKDIIGFVKIILNLSFLRVLSHPALQLAIRYPPLHSHELVQEPESKKLSLNSKSVNHLYYYVFSMFDIAHQYFASILVKKLVTFLAKKWLLLGKKGY